MQKNISIYDPYLITSHHSLDLIKTPKLEQKEVQKAWNLYYDENCQFFEGNLFITGLQRYTLRDFYIYFLLPRVDIPGRLISKTRPFTPRENSHLLAACWEYILKEENEFKKPKNLLNKNLKTIDELLKYIADNHGYTLANIYICTEELKITSEDKLSLLDQKKRENSKKREVSAIPFIHYLAAHTRPGDPEQAKRERHKVFTSLVFRSRDNKEAIDVRTPDGVTVADRALINGNYDVYELIKNFRGFIPPFSQLFIAKDFSDDKKNDFNPIFYAKSKKDFALLNTLLQLPGCEKILKIRAADDGLTLLEWAVIQGNYQLVAEIYRCNPSGISLALSMAGKKSIKKLYSDSLQNKLTHDAQLRDLLHCYITEYPGIVEDIEHQMGYFLGLIQDEKITEEGLKLILNHNKNLAIILRDNIKSLSPKIQKFIHQWPSENNTFLGQFWSKLNYTDQDQEHKEFDYKKISPKFEEACENKLVLPIFSDMKFSYVQEQKSLPLVVREAIEEAKSLKEIKESTEFGYALFLSGGQHYLEEIIGGVTPYALDWEYCIEEDFNPKKNIIISNLISALLKGEIDIQSVLIGSQENVKRIRVELCQFVCDQKSAECDEIIRCSLTQSHPLRKLWDEDSLRKLFDKRKKLCHDLVKEAKEIFIRIIKNSSYFPELKEGDEQKKQDSSHFFLKNVLAYRQIDMEEGENISTLPLYLFFNPDKLPRYLNFDQMKSLRELDEKTHLSDLEIKHQVKNEQKLVDRFNIQREIYLNNLKEDLSPIKVNFILGKILVCNQALRILSHPKHKVSPELLHTWKKSFPQNVFNDSYSLEGLVKELIKFRADQSLEQSEEKEEECLEAPPPFNPELPLLPPPPINPYLFEDDSELQPGSNLIMHSENISNQEIKNPIQPAHNPEFFLLSLEEDDSDLLQPGSQLKSDINECNSDLEPGSKQEIKNLRPPAYNPEFFIQPLNEEEPGSQQEGYSEEIFYKLAFLPLPPRHLPSESELDLEPGLPPKRSLMSI